MADAPILDDDLAAGPAATSSHPLYDQRAVTIATLLGSSLAGGLLMTLNARRLGLPAPNRPLLVCFAFLFVGAVASAFLPEQVPPIVYTLVILAAVVAYFDRTQQAAIALHRARGGKLESRWRAAGIGGAFLLGFLLLGMLAFVFVDLAGPVGPGGVNPFPIED